MSTPDDQSPPTGAPVRPASVRTIDARDASLLLEAQIRRLLGHGCRLAVWVDENDPDHPEISYSLSTDASLELADLLRRIQP